MNGVNDTSGTRQREDVVQKISLGVDAAASVRPRRGEGQRAWTRLTIRLAAALWLGLAALSGAIRMQPANDAATRELLGWPGCDAPCYWGVQMGESTGAEAQALLRGHPWVGRNLLFIRPLADLSTSYWVWDWSGQQPQQIDEGKRGQLLLYRSHAASVRVQTRVALGDLRLLLGEPAAGIRVPSISDPGGSVTTILVYPDSYLILRVTLPRGASLRSYWDGLVEVEFASPNTVEAYLTFAPPRPCGTLCVRSQAG